METAEKRFLLVITLRPDSDIPRIAKDVPKILDFISSFSKGDHEQAFHSNDRLLFGYFLTTANSHFLRAEFEKCEGTTNGDHLLVVEIGELIAGTSGFSRGWTWLQRHQID